MGTGYKIYAMAGQGLKYNVDIVMCIDCTGSMGDLLDTVKNNALKFYPDLRARCDEKGKEISELRIRAIAFRDFAVDGNGSVEDTGFLNIPESETEFKNFVSNLRPSVVVTNLRMVWKLWQWLSILIGQ